LKTLLGSTTRAKLLSHFLLHPGEAFHVRELERLLYEPAGNLLRDLRRLRAIGILSATRVGNQVRYTLDQSHPLREDLQRIVVKATAADAILREVLAPLGGIELAFIYGSLAKGEGDPRSDLDVMVVGRVSDRVLAPAMARAEKSLGRQVSHTVYTRDEVRRKVQQAGSFIQTVFSGPRIVIVGTGDDALFRAASG
jgi:predicted nucleotidyltransferase